MKMGTWFRQPLWSRDISAADFAARCSYYKDTSPTGYDSTYKTLCNSLSAISSLESAIENMRWNAIDWTELTGSGEGPFVPSDNTSKSLRDKWQVINYARQALWDWDLSSDQRTTRCELFSASVSGNDLQSLCKLAVVAATAPEAFFNAMDTHCWGKWDEATNQQSVAPLLSQDQCLNSDIAAAFSSLSGDQTVSLNADGTGDNETYNTWNKWKVMDLSAEAVWNRQLAKTIRQSRCSNLSADNATSDSANYSTLTTSLKDLCLAAVNSDSAVQTFDSVMSSLTEGPYVDWSGTWSSGSSKIVESGTQPWEKTYKLRREDGSFLQFPSSSFWANWAADNESFPGKWAVANYLQEVMWNFQSNWNPSGLTGAQIEPRCDFFVSTDNISDYCKLMPTAVDANSVFFSLMMTDRSEIPSTVNLDDSRILRREENGYLFNDPQAGMTLFTRTFPKETFNGSTTWSATTEFDAAQVFSLMFAFLEPRVQSPRPSNVNWGVLDSLSANEKKWVSWSVMSRTMMGDGFIFQPLLNALDNMSALDDE